MANKKRRLKFIPPYLSWILWSSNRFSRAKRMTSAKLPFPVDSGRSCYKKATAIKRPFNARRDKWWNSCSAGRRCSRGQDLNKRERSWSACRKCRSAWLWQGTGRTTARPSSRPMWASPSPRLMPVSLRPSAPSTTASNAWRWWF